MGRMRAKGCGGGQSDRVCTDIDSWRQFAKRRGRGGPICSEARIGASLGCDWKGIGVGDGAADYSLPDVVTPLERGAVLQQARLASRRGKLAGFRALAGGDGAGLFSVAAFGEPFDRTLTAECEARDSGSRLRFTSTLNLRLPMIFAVVLVLTVEPGRYFLDKLIPGEWGWIDTRIWYYPLAIIPIPFMWRGWVRKSRRAAHEHGLEQIGKIAVAVEGDVEA